MDALSDMMMTRAPTARRPLLGLTVLIVEDSRFASEAVRLMCLRSGARIRRADSLENARRHLVVYCPTVVLVDVGLPDGSGLDLIEALAESTPRIGVILGASGDTTLGDAVIGAGADGFLEKPLGNLAQFQNAILQHLPADRQPPMARGVSDDIIEPDQIALMDDLVHVAAILKESYDTDRLGYATQFIGGLASSAHDDKLNEAVDRVEKGRRAGDNPRAAVANLSAIIDARIGAARAI